MLRAVVALGGALLFSSVLLSGCAEPRPRTQVLVTVVAEPGVTAEMRSLVVRVRGAPVGMPLIETYTETYRITDPGGIPTSLTLAISPAGGDVMRVFEAEAEAIDAVGNTVAISRARAPFQPGRTVELRLLLSDRCRGVVCQDGETCEAGLCVPADVMPGLDGGVADAGVRDGSVVPPGGDCEETAQCDDGVFCNGEEECLSGTCVGGARETCDDGVDCTIDRCIGIGCVHEADASRCTAAENGRCEGADGCQYDVCDEVTCASTGCETAVCEPAPSTRCVRTFACEDGDTCCGGECVAPGCTDGNPCTTDLCGPTGCVNQALGDMPCSDGNACTVGDRCRAGACQPGDPRTCDDTNPCTTDECDVAAGCRAPAAAPGTSCADTDLCDGTEMCLSGTCSAGTALNCDDGIACTVDSCGAGGCVHAATDSLCSAGAGGRCLATGCQYTTCDVTTTCLPGPCETTACVSGECQRTPRCTAGQMCCANMCVPAGCSDGNQCTTDACGPSGCVWTPTPSAPCEDGNACTTPDRCVGMTCTPGPTCDDGNVCTQNVCGAAGCSFPPIGSAVPCDDGDICTNFDRCSTTTGMCVPGPEELCDDRSDCTADRCDSDFGCINEPAPGNPCQVNPSSPCFGSCDFSGVCQAELCCVSGTC